MLPVTGQWKIPVPAGVRLHQVMKLGDGNQSTYSRKGRVRRLHEGTTGVGKDAAVKVRSLGSWTEERQLPWPSQADAQRHYTISMQPGWLTTLPVCRQWRLSAPEAAQDDSAELGMEMMPDQ
ncbi:hypothetical protein BaRGS_00019693 [Batillaria attramentaria]|uniref:Uncharacterized protein n=1 Tax=Batillaria attramentaria TaxID=370345 RepID=A0ABD0KPA9_9CAEN